MDNSRRQFIQAGIGAGCLAAASTLPTRAIEPIRRTGPAHMRLSIAAYSYREYLDLKRPTMTLDDFVDLAAQLNLDAIEPTSYYFADTSTQYLARLKGRCTRLGLDISGTAVGNDFCVADPQKLNEQLGSVKKWVERASLLGAKTIRIFAGRTPKGDSEEAARNRCVETIQAACDYAAKFGVILALENHGGITENLDQMLAIVKAVKHEWFGVNLDTGNFRSPDPYADLARLAPYAVVVQVKTEVHRGKGKTEEADLKRIVEILRSVGYRGYVALEYEATEDPKTAVPRHVETLKKLLG